MSSEIMHVKHLGQCLASGKHLISVIFHPLFSCWFALLKCCIAVFPLLIVKRIHAHCRKFRNGRKLREEHFSYSSTIRSNNRSLHFNMLASSVLHVYLVVFLDITI